MITGIIKHADSKYCAPCILVPPAGLMGQHENEGAIIILAEAYAKAMSLLLDIQTHHTYPRRRRPVSFSTSKSIVTAMKLLGGE